jgi:hypothetical protein
VCVCVCVCASLPRRSTPHLLRLSARAAVAGFFDQRDQGSLERLIGERLQQLEKAFDHGPVQLLYRELVRQIFHRNRSLAVPHSGISGVLRGVRSSTQLVFVPTDTLADLP